MILEKDFISIYDSLIKSFEAMKFFISVEFPIEGTRPFNGSEKKRMDYGRFWFRDIGDLFFFNDVKLYAFIQSRVETLIYQDPYTFISRLKVGGYISITDMPTCDLGDFPQSLSLFSLNFSSYLDKNNIHCDDSIKKLINRINTNIKS